MKINTTQCLAIAALGLLLPSQAVLAEDDVVSGYGRDGVHTPSILTY